jgi:hypothetical protein
MNRMGETVSGPEKVKVMVYLTPEGRALLDKAVEAKRMQSGGVVPHNLSSVTEEAIRLLAKELGVSTRRGS